MSKVHPTITKEITEGLGISLKSWKYHKGTFSFTSTFIKPKDV